MQVVSKVDAEGNPFTKGAAANDWKVSPDLFPIEVPAVRTPCSYTYYWGAGLLPVVLDTTSSVPENSGAEPVWPGHGSRPQL